MIDSKNAKSLSLLVATLAGALALPSLTLAQEKSASEGNPVPCWGINKCKGVGECGADGCRHSGCSGSNACKGQGFLRLSAETCLKIEGGRLTKVASKPAPKK
jgi:uncharacterized membrane protein